ncbi:MAG TPA: YwqG family protein [Phytomonospora sp.]
MHQALADVLARHLADRARRERLATAVSGIRLRHAVTGDVVAGHFGGDALLPAGEEWPRDADGRPLRLLLSLDLAALPRSGLDLPRSGRLLFFRSDDDFDHAEVHWCEGELVEVPADDALTRVEVTAVVEPSWEYGPEVEPPWDLGFPDTTGPPVHRLGGFGESVQYDVAFAPDMAPKRGIDPTDPERAREVDFPVMLAQIDTDDEARISWGDAGSSHWLISREDLAARRFEEVEMWWSCC